MSQGLSALHNQLMQAISPAYMQNAYGVQAGSNASPWYHFVQRPIEFNTQAVPHIWKTTTYGIDIGIGIGGAGGTVTLDYGRIVESVAEKIADEKFNSMGRTPLIKEVLVATVKLTDKQSIRNRIKKFIDAAIK